MLAFVLAFAKTKKMYRNWRNCHVWQKGPLATTSETEDAPAMFEPCKAKDFHSDDAVAERVVKPLIPRKREHRIGQLMG